MSHKLGFNLRFLKPFKNCTSHLWHFPCRRRLMCWVMTLSPFRWRDLACKFKYFDYGQCDTEIWRLVVKTKYAFLEAKPNIKIQKKSEKAISNTLLYFIFYRLVNAGQFFHSRRNGYQGMLRITCEQRRSFKKKIWITMKLIFTIRNASINQKVKVETYETYNEGRRPRKLNTHKT